MTTPSPHAARDALVTEALEAARAGDPERAGDAWTAAHTLAPPALESLVDLTNALASAGHGALALRLCDRDIGDRPNRPEVWVQKALILNGHLADPDGAIAALREACRIAPGDPYPHRVLAMIYGKAGRHEAMRRHARMALTGRDLKADFHLLFYYLSNYDAALALARRLLAAAPDDPYAQLSMSHALRMLGRPAEALPYARRAAVLDPGDIYAGQQAGELALLLGDHARGWEDTRRAYTTVPPLGPLLEAYPDIAARRWRGQPLAGKRILLGQYAGFGDALMFARYGRLLQARGAHVTLSVRPELMPLLQGQPGIDAVIDLQPIEVWGTFDYWLSLYLAPDDLGGPDGVIPAYPEGYVAADLGLAAAWAQRLGPSSGRLKVGLGWSTGFNGFYGLDRSLPEPALKPLAEIPNIDWHGVQTFGDIRAVAALLGDRFHDHSTDLTTFADTAALMANLDLVIASDSAPLHLAGALGKPAFGLIPFAPDWRWGLTGETTPWYPTLRLFRQPRPLAWAEVIAAVAAALSDRAGPGAARP